MARHIHVHLHDAKPPSSVIKPTPNAPHNPPKNLSGIKPAKAAASVIKPVKGGLNVATKGVNLINKTLRKAGELSESKI